MTDITLGSGDQQFLFQRNGQDDTVTDFKSIYFAATLNEDQEVPPNVPDDPAISGTGTGSLNFSQTQFKFSLDIDGIDLAGGADPDDMTDMHIHGAAPGVSGPVIFAFRNDTVAAADDIETVIDTGAGTVTGGWDVNEHASGQDLTAASVTAILGGNTYFNVHTNRDISGYIRGQILKQDNGLDQIDLTALNIGSFATLNLLTSNVAGDAKITAFLNGVASSITLDGVGKNALQASFFVFAGGTAETINGNAGRDDLAGAGGGDTISGGGNNDRLFGEDGADTLNGDNGADRLFGGKGGDILSGIEGSDTITGGAGLDVQTGGAGGDRFVFAALSESGNRLVTADRITDFATGIDKILLNGIDAQAGTPGNQEFDFIGGGTFDAEGQVKVVHIGGNTYVTLNTSGTTEAEMVIRLDGNVAVVEGDFVL